jgi:hypothetical protein
LGRRRFESLARARAAYDRQNFYVSYDVETPFDLVNSIPEQQIIFKGGNLLDIQLATNPTANPKRTKPAPGDLRLLVTRQQGQPIAVIYRPKIKGFQGEAVMLKSPTGQESFDAIEVSNQVKLEYRKTPAGFNALVIVPLSLLGWTPQSSSAVRLDLGYLFGNSTGNQLRPTRLLVQHQPHRRHHWRRTQRKPPRTESVGNSDG